MADSAELAFVKNHLNTIGALPVQYADDYQQPPKNSLKKVPVLSIDLPAPPPPKTGSSAASSASISLTFKSTKPPRTFVLSHAAPTDTIATLKAQLAQQPGAPPADAQRLLLKGKALADGKLLQEYAVKDGDTVNVMLKPGVDFDWDASKGAAAPAPSPTKDADGDVRMRPPTSTRGGSGSVSPSARYGHGRIPSVVLSPSPSASSANLPLSEQPGPIHITLDASDIAASTEKPKVDAFTKKIAAPDFWERLYAFLQSDFGDADDSVHAFEAFLVGAKGSLTPSEIAKIRDTVGVVGMGGT